MISAIVAVELLTGHVSTGSTHVSTLQVAMSLVTGPHLVFAEGPVINYGDGGGGKFYPYKKGDGKGFSHAKGGHNNIFWVVLTWELEVLAILKWGAVFKRGGGAKR